MIEEAYVSFEVAKLLKDKGFDEICSHFYRFDSKELYNGTPYTNSQVGDKIYNSPTQQMAMRWLREIKHIHIATEPYAGYETHSCFIWKNGMGINWQKSFHTFKTYEEACEEAIKFSLKHLIN